MSNYQFGNFNFGQNRMAGQAFVPTPAFVQGQKDYKRQSKRNSRGEEPYQPLPIQVTKHDRQPSYPASVGSHPSNYDMHTNNSKYTNTNSTNQNAGQDANSSYQFGDVDNNVNNNTLGDFSEMNIFNNQYGGDVKSVNISYQGDGAQMKATPIRDLTMAGYFDVSDSPAKTAGFMKKYGDLNRANQSDYSNTGVRTAQKYMNMGANNKVVDTNALDKQVRNNPLYHRDMSRVEGSFTFGDLYANGGGVPKWNYEPKPNEDYGIDPVIKDKVLGNDDDD